MGNWASHWQPQQVAASFPGIESICMESRLQPQVKDQTQQQEIKYYFSSQHSFVIPQAQPVQASCSPGRRREACLVWICSQSCQEGTTPSRGWRRRRLSCLLSPPSDPHEPSLSDLSRHWFLSTSRKYPWLWLMPLHLVNALYPSQFPKPFLSPSGSPQKGANSPMSSHFFLVHPFSHYNFTPSVFLLD